MSTDPLDVAAPFGISTLATTVLDPSVRAGVLRNESSYGVSAAAPVSCHTSTCPSGVSVIVGPVIEPGAGAITFNSAGAGRDGVGRK